MKIFLVPAIILLAVLPMTALAGPRDDSRANIARCDQLQDDHQWLDCVYGAVQPLRSRLGLSPAPDFQQRLVPGGAIAARPLPQRPVAMAPAAPVQRSTENWVHLTAYNFDRRGMFTVTLPDGTIWRQQADDVNYAHWKDAASHYTVSVGEGLGGHGTLVVRNDSNEYQVQRIR